MAKKKPPRRQVSDSDTCGKPPRPRRQKIEWAQAMEIPATCPACGSAQLAGSVGGSPKVRDIVGEIQGEKFERVVWKRRRCSDCGQHVMVRSYLRKAKATAPREVDGP